MRSLRVTMMTRIYRIVLFYIITYTCVIDSVMDTDDTIVWKLKTPVYLRGNASIVCTIHQNYKPGHMAWTKAGQLIGINNASLYSTKYDVYIKYNSSTMIYHLDIKNIDIGDLNLVYKCESGFSSAEGFLSVNEDTFVAKPQKHDITKTFTLKDGYLKVIVEVSTIYPKPTCMALFQDKDITTYSKTVYTKKSMLYSMEFDLVYQTNECGNITISCVIGKEQLRILQISHEFTKDCEHANTNNRSLSGSEVTVIIVGVVVLLVVTMAVAFLCFRYLRPSKIRYFENPEEKIPLMKRNFEEISEDTDLSQDPKIIDKIIDQTDEWKKKDNMFVSTRASDYVKKCLQNNSCVTLTGPPGVGKSFIARHTALKLQEKGYFIIPVNSPIDIHKYYEPGKLKVFIVDDICGKFTAHQQQIKKWKQLLPVIDTIITDTRSKIIVSCRLEVYTDKSFDMLLPFKSCECNLISKKLSLTSVEKDNIAKTYIGTSVEYIDQVSKDSYFFPLLCSLYHHRKGVDIKEFFRNPFDVIKIELDILSNHGDEGNYKLCSLALCVLFNNNLKETWFDGKEKNEQHHIIRDACEACNISRKTSKVQLKNALETLDGTYICKEYGIYRAVHEIMFDFLAHYFGQKMVECLIVHGDSKLVHERLILNKSPYYENSKVDFNIEISDDYLESYLKRMIKDWSAGRVTTVFSNINMKNSVFRQQLLQFLQQLDKSQQVTLANTMETLMPAEEYKAGDTPLILTCNDGYIDLVQWLLNNDVNVDQKREDGNTGLTKASQQGHTDIVKLLLSRNPDVNLYDENGYSPLYWASQNGHTDIVTLLLERNPDVAQCDENGRSPLYWASQKGHKAMVKLLLKKNPVVDLCDNDGCSPLYMASKQGHTDIVKLLLEKNHTVDLCDNNGSSPLYMASQQGHTDIVRLLLEKNPNIDLCDKNG